MPGGNREKPDLIMVGENEACWFCNVQEPLHSAVYKFYMNRSVGKEDEVITVHAVRCGNCKKMHFQQHFLMWAIFIGLCFSLMLFVSSSKGKLNDIFFVSIFMLIFKSFWSDYLIVRVSKKMGIRSTKVKDLRNHPVVSQHINTGWGFGEPTV